MSVWKWFKVNEDISQAGKLCQQSIFDMVTDSVAFCCGEQLIDFDMDVGEVLKAGLAHPERFHNFHTGNRQCSILDPTDKLRFRLNVHQLARAGAEQLNSCPDNRSGHNQ